MDEFVKINLKFTKMHGAGNDFVVIDAIRQSIDLSADDIRTIADRHFGVGCDQLLLVEVPRAQDVDFRYRIFNADGSEVEQCGNGARCFAHFVRHCGLTDSRNIRVETAAGIISLKTEKNDSVTVNMGPPHFLPTEIPFLATLSEPLYHLEVAGESIEMSVLSMGNPHAVLSVMDVDNAPVNSLGAAIEAHERFPQRVNVGFAQTLDSQHLRLRVFERGVGETLSCGTGACAAVVSGIRQGQLKSPVQVDTHGGVLTIAWEGGLAPVYLSGPTAVCFDGEIPSTFWKNYAI